MRWLRIIALALPVAGLAAVAEAGPVVTPAGTGDYHPPKPKKGFRYPDCFCTDSKGKRVEMGQTSCLTIGSRQILARCDMSLNNPTWRRISNGCPNV